MVIEFVALAMSTMGDDGPEADRAAALELYENMVFLNVNSEKMNISSKDIFQIIL